MAYVNERISDEDMIKYKICETAWGYASYRFRSWVIDRERDIFLRWAFFDSETPEKSRWSFYWKGYQWGIYADRISYESCPKPQRGKKIVHFRFARFPVELLEQVEEIKADFSEAYCADLLNNGVDTTFLFEITTETK